MKTIDETELQKEFGKFIKEGRERMGLSQRELAREIGVSQGKIGQIEIGIRPTDLTFALQLCQFLKLDMKKFVRMYMSLL